MARQKFAPGSPQKKRVFILKLQEATVYNSFLKLWTEAIHLPDAKEIIEAVSGTKPHRHRHSKPARLSPYLEAHMDDRTVWQERERLKIHIQMLSGLCQQMATGYLPSPVCLRWHEVASQLSSKSRGQRSRVRAVSLLGICSVVWTDKASFGPSCLPGWASRCAIKKVSQPETSTLC